MHEFLREDPRPDLDPKILAILEQDREAFKRIEDKLDVLIDKLQEFAEQIEESVVRIEDAGREPRDDY
jgi:hypothetical protein